MKLLDIDSAVKERFPDAELYEVCRIVNDLEHRMVYEIFSPCGIPVRTDPLNFNTDAHAALLLKEEHTLLYVYYVFWMLSLNEMNLEVANAYSALFSEKYNRLAIEYRRNYTPVKNTPLTGRV